MCVQKKKIYIKSGLFAGSDFPLSSESTDLYVSGHITESNS